MSHLHQKVSALVDGELSPNARARALAHARGCPQCQREIAETLEVKRRVTRLAPIEVSPDLLDVVGAITRPSMVTVAAARSTLPRRVSVGVGSVSAVVVVLAYVVGAPEPSQANPVRPPVEEFAAEFADGTGVVSLSDPAVGGLGADLGAADSSPVSFGTRQRPKTWPVPVGGPTNSRPAPDMASASRPADDPEAVGWLRRATEAPLHVGFDGARIIRSFAPGDTESFRLWVRHVPGQGTEFDVLRANGRVQSQSFVAEIDAPAADRGLDAQQVGPLVAAYDLSIAGRQQIDGRATTVVVASQDNQVKAQFWLDDATGLLLRRALYVDGRLVRWSGFTSIQMNPHGFMKHLAPEVQEPQVTALSTSVAAALGDKGWTCPHRLAEHFRLSFLHQLDNRAGVMHVEYTDGVSTISVFEEHGSLDTSSLRGFRVASAGGNTLYLKAGLPMTAVWESGGTVFTVVTDAPEQLAGALVSRLPHADDHESVGVTTRVGDGLSRLASAVSP